MENGSIDSFVKFLAILGKLFSGSFGETVCATSASPAKGRPGGRRRSRNGGASRCHSRRGHLSRSPSRASPPCRGRRSPCRQGGRGWRSHSTARCVGRLLLRDQPRAWPTAQRHNARFFFAQKPCHRGLSATSQETHLKADNANEPPSGSRACTPTSSSPQTTAPFRWQKQCCKKNKAENYWIIRSNY